MFGTLETWEKWRAKGPWNFVLKVEALAWGLGEAVVIASMFAWVARDLLGLT